MADHPSVLLTCSGQRVDIVRAFRDALVRRGEGGRVIVSDLDPLSPSLVSADMVVELPAVDDPGYGAAVADVVAREGAGAVLPLTDLDPVSTLSPVLPGTRARTHGGDLQSRKTVFFRSLCGAVVPSSYLIRPNCQPLVWIPMVQRRLSLRAPVPHVTWLIRNAPLVCDLLKICLKLIVSFIEGPTAGSRAVIEGQNVPWAAFCDQFGPNWNEQGSDHDRADEDRLVGKRGAVPDRAASEGRSRAR